MKESEGKKPAVVLYDPFQGTTILAELGICERVTFSKSQRELLLMAFERNSYPSTEEKQTLARDLGIPLKSVNQWFFDERKRRKKLLKHS